jgi:MFS family permease
MSAPATAGTSPRDLPPGGTGAEAGLGIRRLWRRELAHYPALGARLAALAIVVLTTILFYYQYYLISGVSEQVLTSTGISFLFFVNINVVSALASALASLAGGVCDRWGRANVVTVGVLLCALICLFGFPNVDSGWSVGILYSLLGAIEGTVLVATPALIRDFSPQLGRASAMGFWTIGPVAGSLIVSAVVSNTADHLSDWRDQYVIAGFAGLGVFLIALFFLRELSPGLRDQIMVSERDRVLVEARAKGLDAADLEAAMRRPWRQMLHLDIVGSALAISLFLFIYFVAVGFFPIFFQTLFGFSTSQANALGNWMWGCEAVALILIGWVSDGLRVRKPFMVIGAVGAVACTLVLIDRTGHADTSYYTFVGILVPLAISLGLAFAPWMASFTETVERRNPALTATGLALWGLTIRAVVTVSTFLLPYIVTTVTPLVQDGPTVQAAASGQDPTLNPMQNAVVKAVAADPAIVDKVQTLAAKYKAQLATAARLTPATQAALTKDPSNTTTQAAALSEISGKPVADVARVIDLSGRYTQELATAQAIDDQTIATVLTNPADAAATARADDEIATKLGVSPADAQTRLDALRLVPLPDLLFMSSNGDAVQKAADQLTALAAVPAADLDYLDKYGTPLQNPRVQAVLMYLDKHGAKVQKAAKDSPGQWQTYFWIAVGGEIVFIPLIFLMAGPWRPSTARRQDAEHRASVDAELARLAAPAP